MLCIDGTDRFDDLLGLSTPNLGFNIVRLVSNFKENVLGVGRLVSLGDLFP